MLMISIGGEETVLNLIMVTITKLCEYTKNHEILHFKWVNYMLYDLCVNKAVMFKHKRIP